MGAFLVGANRGVVWSRDPFNPPTPFGRLASSGLLWTGRASPDQNCIHSSDHTGRSEVVSATFKGTVSVAFEEPGSSSLTGKFSVVVSGPGGSVVPGRSPGGVSSVVSGRGASVVVSLSVSLRNTEITSKFNGSARPED